MIIKPIYKNLIKSEFIRYILVGGTATLIDWILFYIFALKLIFHYQIALIISFSTATIVHYILSKKFTFKCRSKKIIKQISLFFLISILSLSISIFIMFIFIDLVLIPKMISRILTTGILLIVNYLIHKNITFNKKFF